MGSALELMVSPKGIYLLAIWRNYGAATDASGRITWEAISARTSHPSRSWWAPPGREMGGGTVWAKNGPEFYFSVFLPSCAIGKDVVSFGDCQD